MGKRLEEIEILYGKGKQCLKNEHIDYLLSEVKQLMEAIEKHREASAMWSYDEQTKEASAMFKPDDKELYKALEEE